MLIMKPALALLALLAATIAAPLVFSNPTITSIAVLTVIYAGATTAWNIFAGYTGYIALGHAVFFGTGAYALAILCKDWHVTSDYGPILMLAALRANRRCHRSAARRNRATGAQSYVRGHHNRDVFHRATLVYNLRDLTNGSAGLELPIPSWTFDVYNLPFYYSGLDHIAIGAGNLVVDS